MILGEDPIADAIKQWRINLGITIAEAAKTAGVAASQWGRIESGRVGDPNMRTVIKMFAALGAQVEVKIAPRQQQWWQ